MQGRDRLNRRSAVIALAALGALLPLGLSAQQAKRHRIGVVWSGTEAAVVPYRNALVAGLQDFGYLVGGNLELHDRYFHGDENRRAALVDELIALKPDVLVAGLESTARAVKAKTSTIPIVFLLVVDPVAAGLVQSLSRPGANATGPAMQAMGDVIAKRLELAKEIVPGMSHYAVLFDETEPLPPRTTEPLHRSAAKALGLSFSAIWLRNRADLDRAFSEIRKGHPDVLFVSGGGLTNMVMGEIAAEALRLRVPANSVMTGAADAGFLFTYGVNTVEVCRYATRYVDRILKGAKPADLPVEQYSKYEFVVNLRTAKALGIKIPPSVLVRADRVIE